MARKIEGEDLGEETSKETKESAPAGGLKAELEAARARIKELEARLAGDVVVLAGKVHRVLGTHRADNTFHEVKRGHVDEGTTLVAIDRKE